MAEDKTEVKREEKPLTEEQIKKIESDTMAKLFANKKAYSNRKSTIR